MTDERILIIEDDPDNVDFLLTSVLASFHHVAQATASGRAGLNAAQEQHPDLVLLDLGLTDIGYARVLQQLRVNGNPPVIVLARPGSEAEALRAIRLGACDALVMPFSAEQTAHTINRVLRQQRITRERDRLVRKLAGSNIALEQSLATTQTLYDSSKKIASSLNLHDVLTELVNAAISMAQAEESYFLLRKPDSDELYLRVSRNLNEEDATSLCVQVDDGIARQVIYTGEAVSLFSEGEASIVVRCRLPLTDAGHRVRSLVNIPLCSQTQVIGVLGLINKVPDRKFTQSDVASLSALAASASLAIKNAQEVAEKNRTLNRVLEEMSAVRYKTEMILSSVSEGVYTVNQDLCITSANEAMERITGWRVEELLGRRYDEVFIPQTKGRRISTEHTVPARALHSQSRVPPTQSTILRKDDHRILVTGSAVLLKAVDESIIHVLATMRDLSPEVRLSQAQLNTPKRLQSSYPQIDQWTEETVHILHSVAASGPENCHPITLKPIITQVVQNYRGTVRRNSLQVTLPSDLPFAVGNENQIELALVHLIEYALLLTEPERPINISGRADHDSVVVVIEGSELTNTPKAFERLSLPELSVDDQDSLNEDETPWYDPPQIKLYIARKLIRAQGGELWTEKHSESGTRLQFSLPKVEVKDVAQALID